MGVRKQKVLSANAKMYYGLDVGSFVYNRQLKSKDFGPGDPFFNFIKDRYYYKGSQTAAISASLPLEFSIAIGKQAILLNNAFGVSLPVYQFSSTENGWGEKRKSSGWLYSDRARFLYTAEAMIAFAFNARYKIHSLAVGPAVLLETIDFTTDTFRYSYGLAVQMRF